ncbi:hypothetical protein [Micromonospora sp. DT31]|uniref:hypothetical protein n=1 Tax=Micromonospora sp. DT31 TaxID=3393434 RepID=UPI003CE7876A
MGFFGTYLFNGHRWTAHHPAEQPTIPEPWLLVDIHDSDIATITYRPPGEPPPLSWSFLTMV